MRNLIMFRQPVLSAGQCTQFRTCLLYTSGIEAVTAEALTGETAAETLQGFDFTNDWAVTDADYPVIKADAGEHKYDKTAPGEVWSGKPSRYYASGTGTAEEDVYKRQPYKRMNA